MSTPRLQIRAGNPDFLDLPWESPIDDWTVDRVVEMPSGVHRHPVVFVAYEEGVFAIKELPARLAQKEYEVMSALEVAARRSAEPVGLVARPWVDPHSEQAAAVITRFVEHSFPYRHLVAGPGFGRRRDQMLDALAGLLVELHLVGLFWGDCSLSNVLYRYDAGAIEAIMIDGETASLYPTLSDGQRMHDLDIMRENLAGEMSDIAAMNNTEEADLLLGDDVIGRYLALWEELIEELIIGRDEGYRIRERIARLNELGFSVHDMTVEPSDEGGLVRMRVQVGSRTYNSERLRELTGIQASENQAKVLLSDINYHLAKTGSSTPTGKNVGVFRWLSECYEPLAVRIAEVYYGDDPLQGYCDFLHHRIDVASERGFDVPNDEAFDSWVSAGFPGFPLPDTP